jgi:hypothetical protein
MQDSDYGHGFDLTEYNKVKSFMREQREKKRWYNRVKRWILKLMA